MIAKQAKRDGPGRPPGAATVQQLATGRITLDGAIQPRTNEDLEVEREYAAAWIEGAEFPPIAVFWDRDEDVYYCADGFHRVRAALKAGIKSIKAEVYLGTKRDAILHAVGANATHGLKRTNADKKAAVIKLLDDAEWCIWSDREIAAACHVSAGMVADYRGSMPELRGHGVEARIGSAGTIRMPTGRADAPPSAGRKSQQSSPATMKATPLSKHEIHQLYASKMARHLCKLDPETQTNVKYEFGTVEIVTSRRLYHTLIGRDADYLYRVLGKLMVARACIDPKLGMTLVGHFAPHMQPLIDKLAAMGVECVTPEQVLRGK